MPLGYLAGTVLLALGVLAAVAPIRRPRFAGLGSYLLSMIVNEIPLIAGAFLIGSTLLAFAEGDIITTGASATVGLAALTLPGLAYLGWRGRQAGPVLLNAITSGLGPDWHVGTDSQAAARLRRRASSAQALLAPFRASRRDVRRDRNIAYGTASKRNKLDVYRPRAARDQAPVLIFFHGGGYFTGSKRLESRAMLYRLASQGWVCISANYRLRQEVATFKEHVIDAKRVIKWVRDNGHAYGADPDVVVLAGSSAGAHMAALAAFSPADSAYQPGFESADTSVAGVVCLYGYYGPYYGRGPDSSPTAQVSSGAPPFFVVHGTNDTYVPVAGARSFVDALRAVSASPVVYAELPGTQHSFDMFASPRFEKVVAGIEVFANRVAQES
jgi:acetyl esterase/lipase